MKHKSQTAKISHDLKFTFKNCKMYVLCDEEIFTDQEIQKITNIVNHCSKEINIDKSYVNLANSNYEITFIKKQGWRDLCDLVQKTKFANNCSQQQLYIILESYKLLIITYLYHILQLYGFDTEYILIDMKDNTKFMSIVEIDDSDYVFKYPGKWQLW